MELPQNGAEPGRVSLAGKPSPERSLDPKANANGMEHSH